MVNYSNIYPTRCNVTQFILSGNCSTSFGQYHHPSSGAQTTVYSTWYLSHHYCYLPLSWKSWNWFECASSLTMMRRVAAGLILCSHLCDCLCGSLLAGGVEPMLINFRLIVLGLGIFNNYGQTKEATQTISISSTIAADSSNGVTNARCCRYSCLALLMVGDGTTRNM